MVKNLIKMMDIRTKIEEKYAAELEKFSQTQRKLFANMYENEHTKHVVRAFAKVYSYPIYTVSRYNIVVSFKTSSKRRRKSGVSRRKLRYFRR